MPVFDGLVTRDKGSFSLSVYRKPTHTNRYFNFRSHHPVYVKWVVVKYTYDRARFITTNVGQLKREEVYLKDMFMINNYVLSAVY